MSLANGGGEITVSGAPGSGGDATLATDLQEVDGQYGDDPYHANF